MNLIEQLGGYECAKAEYSDPMYEDGELYTIKATGTRFFKHNLAEELIEYRRQHKIYEVGDKVVLKNSDQDNVLIVQEFKDGFIRAFLGDSIKYSFGHAVNFRHAEPEELEAGKGLEVS